MKKETIILSLIALVIGLLVAGGFFFAYQAITSPPERNGTEITLNATPTPVSSNSDELMVNEPEDESVVENKSVTISGKTIPGSVVVIASENGENVAEPAENGDFSVNMTISEGVNIIEVVSILPTGEERRVVRTVTYSTETF